MVPSLFWITKSIGSISSSPSLKRIFSFVLVLCFSLVITIFSCSPPVGFIETSISSGSSPSLICPVGGINSLIT